MTAVLSRLEASGRTWWGQIGLRAFGLLLLFLCAACARCLHWSVHQLPTHQATAREFLAAALTFLTWASGWAFLAEGPGLFQRVEVPARYRRNILL